MSSRLLTTERSRVQTTYALYCVNIFGSGLSCIKDEFIRRVEEGLRQTLFIIDLEDIQAELRSQPRNTKMKRDLRQNFNTHVINLILQRTQEFRKNYEMQIKKINEELKFDLFQYLLKDIGTSSGKTDNTKKNVTTIRKDSKAVKQPKETKVTCNTTLIARPHNRVGQPIFLSKRKFIKDEPILGKLYIIILGQMNPRFYTDLLSENLPLEGIIHFIPTESNYEIMLGNKKIRNFIMETLEAINFSIYTIRQEDDSKPVGIFTHELPVLSSCSAAKYSREIFDQLTWSIYDIDMLKLQYEMYYFKPFQVTDVEMPASVDLAHLYHVAESLAIQGQFQKSSLPTSDADLASIVCYLDSLLNACSLEVDTTGERHSLSIQNKFRNSFSTITKYQRLVVAENNKLLLNMLQYADLNKFQSIYLCCLDYDVFGQYITLPPLERTSISTNDEPEDPELASLTLPRYVKYYANLDCFRQRLKELLNDYDEHKIKNIAPGYKLHTFKRNYNVVNEDQGTFVIPTRLCFRDFTIFQMEEFLKVFNRRKLENNSITSIFNNEKKVKMVEYDENIFIRPNSLKALLVQNEKSSENKNRKSESRSSRSKSDKKSSMSRATLISEDSLAIPMDYPLLKGYNLEDTLQEIKYKTSKYYFHNGFVKLYEEKWCFQDTNKQLSLSINNATLFFSRPRHQPQGISNNIRLITSKNNISIRILNQIDECSKVVMNYPNGLSVFYQHRCCEQVWYCEKPPENEHRRIFTQLGAIIIFNMSSDLVTILRYNGEVYRLYQHELVEEHQEEDLKSNLGDIEEKSSQFDDSKAKGDTTFVQNAKEKTSEIKRTSKTSSAGIRKSKLSQKLLSEESVHESTLSHDLESLINDELQFLNILCSIYNLTFIHLIITTSQGKRINLTQEEQIYEGPPCTITEWHDYAANESYCDRSDGVKMIWTQDCFKCFHEDGSIFTTTVEEDMPTEYVEDLESQITQSSSHNAFLEEQEENSTLSIKNVVSPQKQTPFANLSRHILHEAAEEHVLLGAEFVRYKCRSYLMKHPNYSQVYVLNPNIQTVPVHMEIFGIDNIRIYTETEVDVEQNPEEDFLRTEYQEFLEAKRSTMLMVHVWFGETLHVIADKASCKIIALYPQFADKNVKTETLTLYLNYKDYINDAFQNLVYEIALFETGRGEEVEELYLMEKINTDASIRGFEFFSSLPERSKYKYHVSNNIIELNAVNTINENVICICEGHKRDLKKFPRFKQKREKTSNNKDDEFPRLLSANIFMEIPKQLLSVKNVTKFLEPFENIQYKSLRGKFRDVLNFYLEPKQRLLLKLLSSRRHWKKRQWEHERRIFTEKQRLGLYYAMNKHQIYPDYWHFTQTYSGEIRHIEFFDFMQTKCKNKGLGQSYISVNKFN